MRGWVPAACSTLLAHLLAAILHRSWLSFQTALHMRRIHKLPDLLVNKIAAGEVIERPASVAKELLENALDAEASRIELCVADGGRKLIRVTDNGCGMSAEDLATAILPHATSKITCEDDLFRIGTMGFRGEALASIGAVAHVTITSRPHDVIEGAQIYVAADQVQSQMLAGCAAGTTVEVRDLFFNVPARQKFLRGASTEFGHIQEQLARIALPNPIVEFELTSGTRRVKHLPPTEEVLERISSFYGEELAEQLLPIQRTERGVSISGFIAKPAQNRTSAKWQYLFLNGRYIRDRFVQHAVREAYRGLMEPARYPIVFLSIDIPPDRVDVNVHPTKIEVRWQDSSLVYSQVLSAVRETLLQRDLTPTMGSRPARAALSAEERLEERRKIAEFFKQASPANPLGGLVRLPSAPTGTASATRSARSAQSPLQESVGGLGEFDTPADTAPAALQVHRTYLVAETEEGLMVIDQHALHERVIYEQLVGRITAGTLERQRLLIPEIVNLTARHVAVLEEFQQPLVQVGVEVSPYSADAIAVHTFPSILKTTIIEDFVRDVAEQLLELDEKPETEVLIHKILDMMACKAAVKAGDPLTPAEIRHLIAQRHVVERSSNCPHGRPTTLTMTIADLERQFKRK